MRSKLKVVVALALVVVFINSKAAEVEVGVGAFATSLPKYIGSDEQSNYVLPFPYFYFKSDQVEVDRNALTGFIWQQNNWYLDLSASGNIPVKSDETDIRVDMPDIDFVGELGPAVKYYFLGDPNTQEQFILGFTSRKAMATDFSSLSSIGWHHSAFVIYNTPLSPLLNGELELNTRLSVEAADDTYLDYYYGVSEKYQTSYRPKYTNQSGYSGSSLSVGLTWKKDAIWLGSFLTYSNIKGSQQQLSPLVKKENNWALGVGLVWIFYKN